MFRYEVKQRALVAAAARYKPSLHLYLGRPTFLLLVGVYLHPDLAMRVSFVLNKYVLSSKLHSYSALWSLPPS
jgi:hypothetical protein